MAEQAASERALHSAVAEPAVIHRLAAPRVGLSGPRARRFQDEEWRLRKLSPESSMR